jgi:hypothetical protein
MTGRQLAAHVRERWPKVRVLLISGYDNVGSEADERLLAKPFTASAIVSGVRGALDHEAG